MNRRDWRNLTKEEMYRQTLLEAYDAEYVANESGGYVMIDMTDIDGPVRFSVEELSTVEVRTSSGAKWKHV